MCAPQSGPLRDVHGVTQRRGRKETEVARRIKGGIKRREIQPVVSSLSVLHSPEHTKRFSELGREEKGESGDRGRQGKRGNQKERERDLGSTLFPKCSPQPRTHTEIYRVGLRREGEGRR